MATGFGSAGANTAIDALVAAYPWVKMHVGDPGAAGTANPATETTRKQATWATSSGGSTSNSNTLTWTTVAATEDWTFFTLWTASTAGTFGFSGAVTANALVIGDTASAASGALVVSLTLAS